jgi:hypothetical protein
MSASELDRLLHDLAVRAEWPPTPRFAAVPPRVPARRRYLLAALAAAIALLVFGAAAVASDLLLHSVTIQRVPALPTPSASPSVDPLLGQVEPSVAAASKDAGFQVAVPADLGSPDAVTLRKGPVTIVSLVYKPGPRLPSSPGMPQVGALVSEFKGDGMPAYLGKLVGPGTTIETVDANGAQGVWIAGSPHVVFLGNGTTDELRLATNTLIWERGGVTYRLEADIPRADALRIAETMR